MESKFFFSFLARNRIILNGGTKLGGDSINGFYERKDYGGKERTSLFRTNRFSNKIAFEKNNLFEHFRGTRDFTKEGLSAEERIFLFRTNRISNTFDFRTHLNFEHI
jgi:hypothetical protein